MIESMAVLNIVVAVVFTLFSIHYRSSWLSFMAMFFWIMGMATMISIEVPYAVGGVNSTGFLNYTTGYQQFTYSGWSILCLGMVIITLIHGVILIMNQQLQDKMP